MDVKVGRMNTIIGYNGFLAPYRPFYSSDYQFFYSQDGAFTGFLTDLHVNNRLDIWNGMTLGANTFFTLRSNDSYLLHRPGQLLDDGQKKTRLTASVYCGPHALFAAPDLAGTTTRWWSCVSSKTGATFHPGPPEQHGLGRQHAGRHRLVVRPLPHQHLPPDHQVDALCRAEWFDDVKGTRTGVDTNYSEVTLGLNWHPSSASRSARRSAVTSPVRPPSVSTAPTPIAAS